MTQLYKLLLLSLGKRMLRAKAYLSNLIPYIININCLFGLLSITMLIKCKKQASYESWQKGTQEESGWLIF